MSDPVDPTTVMLKDVAREAGVSTATVDRVLNGRRGVKEATIRRVKETIDRLGFQPYAAAADLARGRSHRFCFIMPRNQNIFMAEIVDHVGRLRTP